MTDNVNNGQRIQLAVADYTGLAGAQVEKGQLRVAYFPVRGKEKPALGSTLQYDDKTWRLVEVVRSDYVKGMQVLIFDPA